MRNRIFAFDATTGVIDTAFNPNLGGRANSLDTDGTYVYVGGVVQHVGGDCGVKRVVKLTRCRCPACPALQGVPNAVVNEVVVRSGRLFVGGGFTNVGRHDRPRPASPRSTREHRGGPAR